MLSNALMINISAAKGLMDVMKTNLGPTGTLKLLVSGGGDLRLTKDGARLASEMQIQLPTAQLISRTATAVDDEVGDGTTSIILAIGELVHSCESYLSQGVHPRVLADGFQLALKKSLEVLDSMKLPLNLSREMLMGVVRSSIGTKVSAEMTHLLTPLLTDAVQCIHRPGQMLDLHMVEIMHMQHKLSTDTQLIRGLVLDHGCRHPDMPRRLTRCHILICNVSLEYEKSEVNSVQTFSTAEQREKLVEAERKVTDDRVRKIIELKREVCKDGSSFVVINQKGIDPLSLDSLAKEGMMGLRRAKKRNMERLALACGGVSVNSVDDLTPSVLGYAGLVYEQSLGEEKYTFVEDVKEPHSCTILVKGPNPHTIAQVKDAIRDGLRACQNAINDNCLIPGAGCFQIHCHEVLMDYAKTIASTAVTGVKAVAESLLITPKTLAINSGFDSLETLVKLQEEEHRGHLVGLDVCTGEPIDPVAAGIFDNYCVQRQILNSSIVMTSQLLLVDEVLRAGKAGSATGPQE
nr:T-complex protein 1 subunit zeta 2 [Paratrimastix eleionoma]